MVAIGFGLRRVRWRLLRPQVQLVTAKRRFRVVIVQANRDDLFSVTSLKHYPYVANSDFHKPKHLYSWKTLLRCDKTWPSVKAALKSNVDVAVMLYRNEEPDGAGASA